MKNQTALLLLAGLFLGSASLAIAGPGLQYWQAITKKAQFEQLKAGDKIAYVCNQCKTVTEKTIESTDEAMDFCKEGGEIACPSCKMKVKIVLKGQRNDPPTKTEITYVNDKGEECMFVAKMAEKK